MVQLPGVLELSEWPQPSEECPVLVLIERMTVTAQKCLWDCQGPEDTPRSPQPCQELKGQIMKPMKQTQHWSSGGGKKVPLPIFLTVATGEGSVTWQGKDHQQGNGNAVGTCNTKVGGLS